jgi:hypothetical protein
MYRQYEVVGKTEFGEGKSAAPQCGWSMGFRTSAVASALGGASV